MPSFAVLSLSDSFEDLWPKLVPSTGARLVTGRRVADLEGTNGLCGVLVSAAGVEDDAAAVVEELRARRDVAVVVVGVETDFRLAITVLRAGAACYYALPDDLGTLRSWIAERVEGVVAARREREVASAQRDRYDFSRMIGRSPALLATLERASNVIPRGSPTVLITGETGTGKELLARAVHYNGPRAAKPFVEINCTALPENLLEAELFGYEAGAFTDAKVAKPGLIESADGGTLFLDEIGDLSLNLQGKLLRVLENKRVRRLGSVRDHEVDVRVIAATHVNLMRAVREKRFREDLFYRLSVVPLALPSLRDRGDDILLLARHFLQHFCREYDLPVPAVTSELESALRAHAWPGNVRELRNAIERTVLLGNGRIRVSDLFFEQEVEPVSSGPIPFPASLERIDRAAAKAMLDWCGGNKSKAARALGISRKHLYSLLDAEGS